MTLKEEVLAWVGAMPEDAESLRLIHERLRMDAALAEAYTDVEVGRTLNSGDFLQEVSNRWPAGRP